MQEELSALDIHNNSAVRDRLAKYKIRLYAKSIAFVVKLNYYNRKRDKKLTFRCDKVIDNTNARIGI